MNKGKQVIQYPDISKVKEGMSVKNFKTLCEILNIEERKANSKVSQLKMIERYLELERKGNSFVIKKVYDMPIQKIETRGRTSIYVENFSIQLLHYLAEEFIKNKKLGKMKEGANYVFITSPNLFLLTGMINGRYYKSTKMAVKDFIIENPSLSEFDIEEFYKYTSNKMKSITKTSLENLKDMLLITYETSFKIYSSKGDFVANDEQRMEVINVQKEVFYKMFGKVTGKEMFRKDGSSWHRKLLAEVFISGRGREFYDNVNSILSSRYKWSSAYGGWKIFFHTSQLKENIERYEQEIEIARKNKFIMNDKVSDFFDKITEKRYLDNFKAYEKYEKEIESFWGESSGIKDEPFKYEDEYLNSQRLLIETLIKLER